MNSNDLILQAAQIAASMGMQEQSQKIIAALQGHPPPGFTLSSGFSFNLLGRKNNAPSERLLGHLNNLKSTLDNLERHITTEAYLDTTTLDKITLMTNKINNVASMLGNKEIQQGLYQELQAIKTLIDDTASGMRAGTYFLRQTVAKEKRHAQLLQTDLENIKIVASRENSIPVKNLIKNLEVLLTHLNNILFYEAGESDAEVKFNQARIVDDQLINTLETSISNAVSQNKNSQQVLTYLKGFKQGIENTKYLLRESSAQLGNLHSAITAILNESHKIQINIKELKTGNLIP